MQISVSDKLKEVKAQNSEIEKLVADMEAIIDIVRIDSIEESVKSAENNIKEIVTLKGNKKKSKNELVMLTDEMAKHNSKNNQFKIQLNEMRNAYPFPRNKINE